MLDKFIYYLFPCTINAIVVIYMTHVILGKSFDFKNYKNYIVIIGLITAAILNFLLVNDLIRFLLTTIFAAIANYLIFGENINRTIGSTIIEQIIMFISEVIFAIGIIVLFGASGDAIIHGYYGQLLSVIIISIIAIALINIGFVRENSRKLLTISTNIRSKKVVITAFSLIIIINVLLFTVYHEIDLLSILFLNLCFLLIYGYIIYVDILAKSRMVRIEAENKALVDNLDEYEKMLDYQRVSNHENKNQLLVIKNLLKENNDEAIDYINEVIKDSRQENDILFTKAKKIPSGGLQGIIYQKMLVMNDKNIKPVLNISNNVKKLKLNNSAKLNYDICRVVGVFLDNAIDEVLKVDDREITISLYGQDDEFVIEIANQFKDSPNLQRIDEKGYTTKGKNHGYGLSLVKEIIDENPSLCNEKNINGNIFTQILKIKM